MTAAAQTNGSTKAAPAAVPAKPPRMTLAAVVKGKLEHPLKVTLYGVEGIGKSTFGAGAPAPIFLGAEEGTQHLDVARFPKPESIGDVFDAVRVLTDDSHTYQTLVVDTLDWLEPIIWRHLIAKSGSATTIEEVGGGYGKGYTAALDEWRRFLAAIERLQAAKRMHVVLIAHSQVKTFKNPEGDDFDRYQMKINDKAAGLVKEWSDAVLFAKHDTVALKDSKTKRVRGVDTGARLIFTERTAAYDAKNRYSLPGQLPLSWADFFAAVKAGQVADPAVLREEIQRKAKELGGDIEVKTTEWLKPGRDSGAMAQMNNRLNALLAEKLAATETAADVAAEKVN
jgi:hypothetical protein